MPKVLIRLRRGQEPEDWRGRLPKDLEMFERVFNHLDLKRLMENPFKDVSLRELVKSIPSCILLHGYDQTEWEHIWQVLFLYLGNPRYSSLPEEITQSLLEIKKLELLHEKDPEDRKVSMDLMKNKMSVMRGIKSRVVKRVGLCRQTKTASSSGSKVPIRNTKIAGKKSGAGKSSTRSGYSSGTSRRFNIPPRFPQNSNGPQSGSSDV